MRAFLVLAASCFVLPVDLLAEQVDSKLLISALPDTVKVISDREVHYCPDNTCAVYTAEGEEDPGHLLEFVFLHLFYASSYIYLQEDFGQGAPFREAAQDVEPRIRDRVEKYCREPDNEPECILEGLQDSLGIIITTRRYDEDGAYES